MKITQTDKNSCVDIACYNLYNICFEERRRQLDMSTVRYMVIESYRKMLSTLAPRLVNPNYHMVTVHDVADEFDTKKNLGGFIHNEDDSTDDICRYCNRLIEESDKCLITCLCKETKQYPYCCH